MCVWECWHLRAFCQLCFANRQKYYISLYVYTVISMEMHIEMYKCGVFILNKYICSFSRCLKITFITLCTIFRKIKSNTWKHVVCFHIKIISTAVKWLNIVFQQFFFNFSFTLYSLFTQFLNSLMQDIYFWTKVDKDWVWNKLAISLHNNVAKWFLNQTPDKAKPQKVNKSHKIKKSLENRVAH